MRSEGYGNAPTESIKRGDTRRPHDGQRINESQRKGSGEKRSTGRGGPMSISLRKTPECLTGLRQKIKKHNSEATSPEKLNNRAYVQDRAYEWLRISRRAFFSEASAMWGAHGRAVIVIPHIISRLHSVMCGSQTQPPL